MEDQGKRLLLAVAIAFLIMMAWSFLFPPDKPKEEDKPTDGAPASGETATGDGTTAPAPDGAKPAADGAAAPAAPEAPPVVARGDATLVTLDFEHFTAVFTTHGGAVKSWSMKGHRFEDHLHGGQWDVAPTGKDGFAPEVKTDLYPLLVNFEPVEGQTSYLLPANQAWTIAKQTPTEIHFTLKTAELQMWKEYTILPDDYLIRLEVKVKNISSQAIQQSLRLTSFGWQDASEDTDGGWARIDRAWRAACYVGGELSTNSPGWLKEKGAKQRRGKVGWVGFTHAYFLQAVAIDDRDSAYTQSECELSAVEGAPRGTMRADMVLGPPNKLEPGKAFGRTFTAYFGPKYLGKLDAANEVAGHDTGFSESVDLGWFGFIARPLLWLLLFFQGLVGNWGIAIVMLTIVVKLVTLYWTTKSMRSMRAMSRLKPKVEEIQKKYKGDRQKSQVEIMNLYKTHGVNPLSGCLPMVLQMPIWIALYQSLRVAAELFQAPLIPGWIDDLTLPDPYYVMPVLLMVMMFVQSRLTPTTADSTQQKIMQYGLPMMFGVMGFLFPAGLTLYILTNTTLTALHHLWMHRTDPHEEPAAAKGGDKAGSGPVVSGRKKARASAEEPAPASDDSGDEQAAAKATPKKKTGAKKRGTAKKKKKSSR